VTQTADGFVTVAKVGDVPEGGVKVVRIEDQPVAVFLVGGRYYAMDDLCTHDGGPLAEGFIEGNEIECPRHGARFDIATGAALCLPATSAVPTYAVKVEGDEIKVGWA
jgi:3-phenylpropionate/trans-cinnamate dioxygenase ferredoxin subunit